MAEMDPIVRDALKRSSQMQNFGTRQQQSTSKKQEKSQIPPKLEKKEQTLPASEPDTAKQQNPINFLFKDKEQSIILLLVVLLMNEDNDPMLLLALMYLLI